VSIITTKIIQYNVFSEQLHQMDALLNVHGAKTS